MANRRDRDAESLLRAAHKSVQSHRTKFPADLVGTVTRPEFHGNALPPGRPTVPSEFDLLSHGEEIFEWLDIASSIHEAQHPLTFVELGAGYGRWSARFWRLADFAGSRDTKIVLVEANPTYAQWAQRHMEDNCVPSGSWEVVMAAISEREGRALFYDRMPSSQGDSRPGFWYGQSLVSAAHSKREDFRTGFLNLLRRSRSLMEGWAAIRVRTLGLGDLLKGLPRVSLMDLDIQNSEGDVVRSGISHLDHKVERLHIGTHSQQAEISLRETLGSHGWRCLRDYPSNATHDVPGWGPISFQDGVQTWINPRLIESST